MHTYIYLAKVNYLTSMCRHRHMGIQQQQQQKKIVVVLFNLSILYNKKKLDWPKKKRYLDAEKIEIQCNHCSLISQDRIKIPFSIY